MTTSSEHLWWLNTGYQRCLSRAEKHFALLQHLLLARGAADDGDCALQLETLDAFRQQVAWLYREHRDWRHSFYYQSDTRKRMVLAADEVDRALSEFGRMRAAHAGVLAAALETLALLPRPAPTLTTVTVGDLWLLAEYALQDLADFIELAAGVTGQQH